MRLITMRCMVAGIVLLVSLALGIQNHGQIACVLPICDTVLAQRANVYNMGENATSTSTDYAFLPLILRLHSQIPWIDPSDRQTSLDYFNQVYRSSEGISAEWTGSPANCNAGETSTAFREAVQLRINYFRSMAGVPGTIQLSADYSRKAQKAALMMSVNGQLSHNPPSSWLCYTDEGAEAAGSSNLFLGVSGPAAITGYIEDSGSNNYSVGHRRWILYPQTQWMGTGDIPSVGGNWSSNALWVFDDNIWKPRPQTRDEYVAWPPAGYVPYQVVFPRWSFAYNDADFSTASVRMSLGGQSVNVNVKAIVNGYGENTLVWEPDLSIGTPPPSDTLYTVNISGVKISGVPHDFTYQVIIFDAGPLAGMLNRMPPWQLNEPPLQLDGH